MKNVPQKILIMALSGIGDALMFTPAITKLREQLPNAQIDALVMFKGAEDIYKRLPELNNVLHFDFLNEGALNSLKYLSGLRGNYDTVFNVYPSNRREYNLISFLLGAQNRVGVRYLNKDIANLGFMNTVTIKENEAVHNVEENIKLVEKLLDVEINEIPGLNFPLTADDKNFAKEYLESINVIDDELVVGFHPGCNTLKNHANRRWATQKFAELADLLTKNKSARILIFGGPEEKHLKDDILKFSKSKNIVIVKSKSLSQSAAVMKRCNAFVSNDSSLMHVASALKLKTVALIGPTNINFIHPWKTEYKIASTNLECAPCFYYSPKPLTCSRNDVKWKCIKELEVSEVYSLVREILD